MLEGVSTGTAATAVSLEEPQKLKLGLPYDLAHQLLWGTWKTHSQHTSELLTHSCFLQHHSQLLRKEPAPVPINGGVDKGIWHIHTVGFYSTIKKNEIMTSAEKMEVETII